MSDFSNKTNRTKRRKNIPRKVSAASIENAALYYLGRYATSSENLRQVLERKIIRASKHHETNIKACTGFVGDLIQRYLENGILNDKIYAQAQAASMNRRGKSLRAIRSRLRQKALSSEIIDKAIEALTDQVGTPDLSAAIAYARKRRLGPYRKNVHSQSNLDKELATLARSGFSYSLALHIVKAKNIDELESEL
jgi:regulatory protein